MALSDKNKGKRDKLSAFGEWLEENAVSKGTSLQEIAQYIGQEYTLVSRFASGAKIPTFEIAQQIGAMVEDADGALIAAGFTPPAAEPETTPTLKASVAVRRVLASGDEILLRSDDTDPEDTARRVEEFLLALRKERGKAPLA